MCNQQKQGPLAAERVVAGTAVSDGSTYRHAPKRGSKTESKCSEDAIVAQAVEILERRLERGVAMTDPAVAGQFSGRTRRYMARSSRSL